MKEDLGIDLVKYSLKAFIWIFIWYFVVQRTVLSYIVNPSATILIFDGILRLVFTILCIITLGKIIQGNGLKFLFSTKGFIKGLFALSAVFLWILIPIFYLIVMSEVNSSFISIIPTIIFFQISSSIFEEALWRGVFMTAILYKWSGTVKGRLISVIISAIVFALPHSYGGMFHVFLAFILGISFSSAYLYSKNLLSIIFAHALWNIVINLSSGLIIDLHISAELLQIIQTIQKTILFVIIQLFAIIISVKASPFQPTPLLNDKVDA